MWIRLFHNIGPWRRNCLTSKVLFLAIGYVSTTLLATVVNKKELRKSLSHTWRLLEKNIWLSHFLIVFLLLATISQKDFGKLHFVWQSLPRNREKVGLPHTFYCTWRMSVKRLSYNDFNFHTGAKFHH